KPGEALVIAHRGYLAWNDRRHRPHESGQQIWHRITSNGSNRRGRAWSGIKSFWRSVRGAGEPLARPVRCQIAFVGSLKWPKNHCPARAFRPLLDTVLELPISSFASLGGFVIRSPSRTPFRLFLGSSAVEHSTVNRMVAGSNPARGATPDRSVPDTWVTVYTEDIGNTFGPKGFARGSSLQVSSSK